MRGRYVRTTWQHNPDLYAPARYRKACIYDAFIPDSVEGLQLQLPGELVPCGGERRRRSQKRRLPVLAQAVRRKRAPGVAADASDEDDETAAEVRLRWRAQVGHDQLWPISTRGGSGPGGCRRGPGRSRRGARVDAIGLSGRVHPVAGGRAGHALHHRQPGPERARRSPVGHAPP